MTTEQPAHSLTDGLKIVSYAPGDDGRPAPVSSESWQPVSEVNLQAWQEIDKQVDRARRRVSNGRTSCLYYYMIANQMNTLLLARYTRQSPLRVVLHLLPFVFKRLSKERLCRYADLFQITPEDLKKGTLRPPVYQPSPAAHD